MSEEPITEAAPANKTVVMLLAAIAVLLVAIVGVIVVQGNTAAPPTSADGAAHTGAQLPPASMGGAMPTGEFDPATATKVPEGQTPEQYVETYFQAIVDGDYATAYELLPADKKAAQTADSFAQQLGGYGINAFEMGQVTEQGDERAVNATAVTPMGGFPYMWTFVKDGDGWLVKSRALTDMGK